MHNFFGASACTCFFCREERKFRIALSVMASTQIAMMMGLVAIFVWKLI